MPISANPADEDLPFQKGYAEPWLTEPLDLRHRCRVYAARLRSPVWSADRSSMGMKMDASSFPA